MQLIFNLVVMKLIQALLNLSTVEKHKLEQYNNIPDTIGTRC